MEDEKVEEEDAEKEEEDDDDDDYDDDDDDDHHHHDDNDDDAEDDGEDGDDYNDENDSAEDEVEDEKVEDDDVEKKMMMLRRRILIPRPGPTLCATLRSQNAWQDFTRATLWPYAEIYGKNAAPQIERQTHIMCEPARSKRMSRFHTEIYGKNAAPQIEPGTQTLILFEPAQSKSVSTCHKRHQKSHFMRKITGEMPCPRMSPERGHTFCASLRSGNARQQDFTRATSHGYLQEKCRSPDWAPAFTPTSRILQCGHFLGNHHVISRYILHKP